MRSLGMAEIGCTGQAIDVLDGGDVDPTSGRLLSVAQLQQALRLAAAMPPAGPQVLPQQTLDQAPDRRMDRGGSLAAGLAIVGDPPTPEISSAALGVVGVSGGCGETVLTQLLAGARGEHRLQVMDTDHRWPDGGGDTFSVVLCARTTMDSLEAAQRAAAQWARGDAPPGTVVGIVLMAAAAGREPRPISDFARILAGGVPQLWRIPWVPAWRLGPPDPHFLPRQVEAVLSSIVACAARCSSVPGIIR